MKPREADSCNHTDEDGNKREASHLFNPLVPHVPWPLDGILNQWLHRIFEGGFISLMKGMEFGDNGRVVMKL